MRLMRILACSLFVLVFSVKVWAASEVIAKVNGKPLTAFELNEEYQDLYPQMGTFHGGITDERTQDIKNKALENLIGRELQYQYALEKGMTVSDKDIESELKKMEKRFGSAAKFNDALKKLKITKKDVRGFIRKRLLVAKAIDTEVTSKANISDEEFGKYYEENKSKFMRPLEMRASQILIGVNPSSTKEQKEERYNLAAGVLKRVRDGENFSDLAMRYSTDTSTAPIGGDLGTFHKGMADEELEKALLAMKVGDVSEIIETLYGYHIVMLTEVKPERQLALDEAKYEVKPKLRKKKTEDLLKKWMDDIRSKASIEILMNK